MSAPPRVLALVGATATGKTALSEALAERHGLEIVCADSRQVFAELDVGTGKPSPAERAARPHHLFEALRLGERASAGWYARAATAACAAVHARGRTPLLVGGSGLYLGALKHGLAPVPAPDPAVRERLRAELAASGPEALHARLSAIDPRLAARLAPRDRQRIVRALEVWESSGRTLTDWHREPVRPPLAARWCVVETTATPAALAERIAARTRAMFDGGLVEETRDLLRLGLERELRRLRAVGYDEAMALLAGMLDRAAAIARVDLRTRQLAKRQRTWFRHQVEGARLEVDVENPDRALARAEALFQLG